MKSIQLELRVIKPIECSLVYKRGDLMFKFAVILVHTLIFLGVTLLGLAGKYNPAPPEPEANYWPWFTMIAMFNLLVLASAFIQLKIKKVWVFLLSILALFILLFLMLQYIWPIIGVKFFGL